MQFVKSRFEIRISSSLSISSGFMGLNSPRCTVSKIGVPSGIISVKAPTYSGSILFSTSAVDFACLAECALPPRLKIMVNDRGIPAFLIAFFSQEFTCPIGIICDIFSMDKALFTQIFLILRQ